MENKPKKIKTALANVTREICEKLYEKHGSTKVYDYANAIKLKYNQCIPCEAETPTISDVNHNTCAICGTHKHL